MLRLLFLLFVLLMSAGLSGQNVTIKKSSDIVVIRGKSYYLHTVQPGQTLFSICKAYGITVDEIKALNDKKDNNLSLYEVLKVPYTEPFVQQDKQFYYHKVVKGETLYSISRKYDIKPKKVLKFNEAYSHNEPLAVGTVIRLPLKEINLSVINKEVAIVPEKQPETVVSDPVVSEVPRKEKTGLEAERPVQVQELVYEEKTRIPEYISEVVYPVDPFVKIALMLPFSAKDYPAFTDTLNYKPDVQISARSEQFLSFYGGILLAVDSLKKRGYKIDLHVYDTERNAEKMYGLAGEINQLHPDLIIGPVYGSVYRTLSENLLNKNIPVIYPLSSRSESFGVYQNYIQVNPSSGALTSAMADWLQEQTNQANLVCIDFKPSNDYSQTDVTEQQVFKERMKKISGMNFFNWDAVEFPLDSLRTLLLPDQENILVLPASKETTVSKILPSLSALADGYRITVAGLPEWQTFTSVDHEAFYKLNTKIFTYSYVDNTTPAAKQVAENYRKYFYTEPNSLVYKAFDMGLYFIDLATRYRDRTLEALEYYPGNGDFSRYRFEKRGDKAGVENRAFYIVNFGSDYRLKIENLK